MLIFRIVVVLMWIFLLYHAGTDEHSAVSFGDCASVPQTEICQ